MSLPPQVDGSISEFESMIRSLYAQIEEINALTRSIRDTAPDELDRKFAALLDNLEMLYGKTFTAREIMDSVRSTWRRLLGDGL